MLFVELIIGYCGRSAVVWNLLMLCIYNNNNNNPICKAPECQKTSVMQFVILSVLFSWQGYLVNWDIERQVWDHLFGKERLAVSLCFCYFWSHFWNCTYRI